MAMNLLCVFVELICILLLSEGCRGNHLENGHFRAGTRLVDWRQKSKSCQKSTGVCLGRLSFPSSSRPSLRNLVSQADDSHEYELDTSNWAVVKTLQQRPKPHGCTEPNAKLASLRLRREEEEPSSSMRDTPSEGARESIDPIILKGVTKPIIDQDVWDQLTGDEFDDSSTVQGLAQTGLELTSDAVKKGNQWVRWKPANKKTAELLQSSPDEQVDAMRDGAILVYTGTPTKAGYGSSIPWVKTRSILPMAPIELAELLMDSSRVQLYNKLSLGRDDLKIMKPGSVEEGVTKIVRNRTQPPISKRPICSVTMMHVEKLGTGGGYLVVSRAVGGDKYFRDLDDAVVRSDILMGVNRIEALPDDPDECMLTAVTHVYSPALPSLVASRLGVSSAVNFIKDVRKLVVGRTS